VISHYHYDHHTKFGTKGINCKKLYSGKLILAKDPNRYINRSQRERAELVWSQLCTNFDVCLEFGKSETAEFPDPVEELHSASKNFGSYQERRRKLLERGSREFKKLSEFWNQQDTIPELQLDATTKVRWVDGKKIKIGSTTLRFSKPRYHGMEYDRIGWVFSIVIERKKKLLHSSDLQGPIIEDYAEDIIRENPDFLILDGPPTYLLGYMMNKINLGRAINNLCRILDEVDAETVIWDHHLLRDTRYRERTKTAYEYAKRTGKELISMAEFLGKKPVADVKI
jgi:hypothetical protein